MGRVREVTLVRPQLDSILGFVERLSELDTENVEPMTTALDVDNRWREDELILGLTNAQAIEILIEALAGREEGPRWMEVVKVPARRAYMHLDTVMTMVDRDAITAYPNVIDGARVWKLRAGDSPEQLVIEEDPDGLVGAMKRALGLDELEVLEVPLSPTRLITLSIR